MENIENKNKELNKYALSILEGLDYEVVKGNGPVGIGGIRNKKTGKTLKAYQAPLVKGSSELTYRKYRFEDSNGQAIDIDTDGRTRIHTNDGVTIDVLEPEDAKVLIKMKYDDGKELSFKYGTSKTILNPLQLLKQIKVNKPTIDVIPSDSTTDIRFYAGQNYWVSTIAGMNYTSEIADFTYVNFMKTLGFGLQPNKTNYTAKKGITIIDPALRLMTEDFKKDWRSMLTDYSNKLNAIETTHARNKINIDLEKSAVEHAIKVLSGNSIATEFSETQATPGK